LIQDAKIKLLILNNLKNVDRLNVEDWGRDIKPEFYAYYADYDWVVFCWLYGKMNDLPEGFPKYCIDLKQELDNKCRKFCYREIKETSFESALERLKIHRDYPKQNNEHNALDDAKWNKKLFEFLNNL
jgi:DNA polymerase III epsilon subunit-like protein